MKRNSGFIDNVRDRASRIVPDRKQIEKQRRHLEKVISGRLKKYEPGFTQFYSDVKNRAVRLGVPVENLENRVLSSYKLTVLKLERIGQIFPFFKSEAAREQVQTRSRKKATKKTVSKSKASARTKAQTRKKSSKAATV